MREHQIVITLKPDQFLEVQRLARAANAKSMGAYVRQKLLAALGIEGTLGDEQGAAGDKSQVDVDAILADLVRVHCELKAFVAESLSPYSPEAFGQSATPEIGVQVVEDGGEALVSPAVPDNEIAPNDELEKVADRTFAISPRLGPIGDPAPMALPSAPTESGANPADLLSRHELHYRRDVHRFHQNHTPVDPAMLPFDAPNPTPAHPAQAPVVDPLSKLLSNEDLAVRQKPKPEEIDEDAFDVPLSLAERRRMMEGEPAPQFAEPECEEQMPEELPTNDEVAQTQAPQTHMASASMQEISPEPAPVVEDYDESGSATASQQTPPSQNELTRPLGYPPLSGSPPPKRRQV